MYPFSELSEVAFEQTEADVQLKKNTGPVNKYQEREINSCKHYLTSKQQKQVRKIAVLLSMFMCIFGDSVDLTLRTVFKQIYLFNWKREAKETSWRLLSRNFRYFNPSVTRNQSLFLGNNFSWTSTLGGRIKSYTQIFSPRNRFFQFHSGIQWTRYMNADDFHFLGGKGPLKYFLFSSSTFGIQFFTPLQVMYIGALEIECKCNEERERERDCIRGKKWNISWAHLFLVKICNVKWKYYLDLINFHILTKALPLLKLTFQVIDLKRKKTFGSNCFFQIDTAYRWH